MGDAVSPSVRGPIRWRFRVLSATVHETIRCRFQARLAVEVLSVYINENFNKRRW